MNYTKMNYTNTFFFKWMQTILIWLCNNVHLERSNLFIKTMYHIAVQKQNIQMNGIYCENNFGS